MGKDFDFLVIGGGPAGQPAAAPVEESAGSPTNRGNLRTDPAEGNPVGGPARGPEGAPAALPPKEHARVVRAFFLRSLSREQKRTIRSASEGPLSYVRELLFG